MLTWLFRLCMHNAGWIDVQRFRICHYWASTQPDQPPYVIVAFLELTSSHAESVPSWTQSVPSREPNDHSTGISAGDPPRELARQGGGFGCSLAAPQAIGARRGQMRVVEPPKCSQESDADFPSRAGAFAPMCLRIQDRSHQALRRAVPL